MNSLMNEKIQYLIKGLTGKDLDAGLLKMLQDSHIDMRTFQRVCKTRAGIEMPPDPRSAKYQDIIPFSLKSFVDWAQVKFPEKAMIHLESWGVNNLKDCLEQGFLVAFREYSGILAQKPKQDGFLEVSFQAKPDEYDRLIPSHEYADDEMDDWLYDAYPSVNDDEQYTSQYTMFVNHNPQLKGGTLTFTEEGRNFHHRLKIEGRPFREALSVVMQKPDITTQELKALLRDKQLMRQFLDDMRLKHPDCRAELRMAQEDIFTFQYGKLGYMTVDRFRQLAEYGEPLDDQTRSSFQNIVKNRQFIDKNGHVFFSLYSGVDKSAVADLYMNSSNGEMDYFIPSRLWDGKTINVDILDGKVMTPSEMTKFVRLADRINDISVTVHYGGTPYEKIMVRCKVDGQQQTAVRLPDAESALYHRNSGDQERQNTVLLRFLGKEHRELLASPDMVQAKPQGLKL